MGLWRLQPLSSALCRHGAWHTWEAGSRCPTRWSLGTSSIGASDAITPQRWTVVTEPQVPTESVPSIDSAVVAASPPTAQVVMMPSGGGRAVRVWSSVAKNAPNSRASLRNPPGLSFRPFFSRSVHTSAPYLALATLPYPSSSPGVLYRRCGSKCCEVPSPGLATWPRTIPPAFD